MVGRGDDTRRGARVRGKWDCSGVATSVLSLSKGASRRVLESEVSE